MEDLNKREKIKQGNKFIMERNVDEIIKYKEIRRNGNERKQTKKKIEKKRYLNLTETLKERSSIQKKRLPINISKENTSRFIFSDVSIQFCTYVFKAKCKWVSVGSVTRIPFVRLIELLQKNEFIWGMHIQVKFSASANR